MLRPTHQHEITSYELGCAINKTLTVSEKLSSAKVSASYCLFLFNNKNRCFLVFVLLQMYHLNCCQLFKDTADFWRAEVVVWKSAIWHWKLYFLGAQSIFFPMDTPWLRIHLGVLQRVLTWLRPVVQTAWISANWTLAWAERVITHRLQLPRHTNSLCDRSDFWSLSCCGGNVMITWRLSMRDHCKKQIKRNHIFWLKTETRFTIRFLLQKCYFKV